MHTIAGVSENDKNTVNHLLTPPPRPLWYALPFFEEESYCSPPQAP